MTAADPPDKRPSHRFVLSPRFSLRLIKAPFPFSFINWFLSVFFPLLSRAALPRSADRTGPGCGRQREGFPLDRLENRRRPVEYLPCRSVAVSYLAEVKSSKVSGLQAKRPAARKDAANQRPCRQAAWDRPIPEMTSHDVFGRDEAAPVRRRK